MKQLKITNKITSRDSQSVDKYLYEIAKLPLINEEEEAHLAKKVRQGDWAAMNTLIKSNLRFVVSVAKQYQNQGLSLNDLINEGNIGLIRAATKFDETKGFKFISYAVWWIRQSILQALIEQPRIVRLPMNKATIHNKIIDAIHHFEQTNQREPTNEELAEILDMKASELSMLRSTLRFHYSVDSPINDEDETTSLDLMISNSDNQPDKLLFNSSLVNEIGNSMQTLTQREKDIVSLYFGLNDFGQSYSLDEIGIKLNITRERVRQIKDKALKKIRRNKNSAELRAYFD